MFVDCQHFSGLWEIILLVTGIMHYNARQFITLFKVRGDVDLWVKVNPETPMNKDDYTIVVQRNSEIQWLVSIVINMRRNCFSALAGSMHLEGKYLRTQLHEG